MKNYYRLLRHHKYPVRFLVARLLMVTGACRFFTIAQKGYGLRFHHSNVAMYRWIAPMDQNEDLEFFRAYLKPGDTVVDVGANIGETVLTESLAVGSSGRVIAFEPHPRTFSFLSQNLELNQVCNVEAHNIGLGEKQGTVSFSDNKRDDMNRVDGDDSGLKVRIDRLDNCVPPQGPVQLLKVDVEGYEKFVFAGAPELLKRVECVYFEVSSTHFGWFSYTTGQLLDILDQAGFQLFRIVQPGYLAAISTSFESEHFENLVALRDLPAFQQRSGWRLDSHEPIN
jgi:FkbM family methyltransferase